GLGNRINTIMQVCFFELANVMPAEEALTAIREAIKKTYAKKGEKVVETNLRAVDAALENLVEIVPGAAFRVPGDSYPAPGTQHPALLAEPIAGRGEDLPVSALPCDGTFPTGTAKYEKRNLAVDIPVWESAGCIQCGKCAMVCPHAAI